MGWVTDHHPTQSELEACVQCGLCLPVCPTFRLTGRETASPRGRLHAMAAVDQGVVEVDRAFDGIIDFCLGCRACEPVCPGMVPYGRMLEGSRAEIVAQVESHPKRGKWVVTSALASRSLRHLAGWGLRVGQTLRLTSLAPSRYRGLVDGARSQARRGSSVVGHTGNAGSTGKGMVGLLAGCIQDEWFRPVNRTAVELLERGGYGVSVPKGQSCCGALAAHDGYASASKEMSEANKRVFSDFDLVVATAAGCSAHLTGYEWEAANPRVLDITVAIANLITDGDLPTLPPNGLEIAIQDPCHLRHAQRVISEPRTILEAAGYSVVEIDPVAMCCGAAGMYTAHHPETSAELGDSKAQQVRATGVTRVASANPGCEMQLRRHLDDAHDVRHPIEWYAMAIGSTQ